MRKERSYEPKAWELIVICSCGNRVLLVSSDPVRCRFCARTLNCALEEIEVNATGPSAEELNAGGIGIAERFRPT